MLIRTKKIKNFLDVITEIDFPKLNLMNCHKTVVLSNLVLMLQNDTSKIPNNPKNFSTQFKPIQKHFKSFTLFIFHGKLLLYLLDLNDVNVGLF